MNTERLHTLARELHTEITSMELVNLVTQLHDYLQGAINSPDEHTQRQVEAILNSLIASLEEAPSNQLSPGMRANLADLFLSEDCSADRLVRAVNRIATNLRSWQLHLRSDTRPAKTTVGSA